MCDVNQIFKTVYLVETNVFKPAANGSFPVMKKHWSFNGSHTILISNLFKLILHTFGFRHPQVKNDTKEQTGACCNQR